LKRKAFNAGWQIFSDPMVRDFFYLSKKPKTCKLQDAEKCRPLNEFGIWQYGLPSIDGTIRFWAFGLVKLEGGVIFIIFPVSSTTSFQNV